MAGSRTLNMDVLARSERPASPIVKRRRDRSDNKDSEEDSRHLKRVNNSKGKGKAKAADEDDEDSDDVSIHVYS